MIWFSNLFTFYKEENEKPKEVTAAEETTNGSKKESDAKEEINDQKTTEDLQFARGWISIQNT